MHDRSIIKTHDVIIAARVARGLSNGCNVATAPVYLVNDVANISNITYNIIIRPSPRLVTQPVNHYSLRPQDQEAHGRQQEE